MKKFIIASCSHFPSSGGLTILHKLCDTLNSLGYDAYLVPTSPSGMGFHPPHIPFNTPYENVKLITQEVYENLQDAVVIYPETWYGNLLNAPNVVRWILGPVNPKYTSEWKETDLWFWFTPLYKTKAFTAINKDFENDLCLTEFHRDIFFDKKVERTINLWSLRKATGKIKPEQYMHDPRDVFLGSINLNLPMPDFDVAGDLVALADAFNKSKRFYCYDAYTFINVQSLMCNTDTIVYPIDGLSREEYFQGYELHKYMAYGLDDLDRAKSIRSEFFDQVTEMELQGISQVHNFVDKCNAYFK